MKRTVLNLKKGEQAVVSGFEGGRVFATRLENLGIRRGKKVLRVSAQLMGGPVVISVDGRQTAVGRNMASRIMVE